VALDELADLVAGLKHSGTQNGAWLSEVRNAINYRFEYGVWYPYDSNALVTGTSVAAAMNDVMAGTLPIPKANLALSDPERACRISGFLIGWLKSSLQTLEATSAGRKKDLITKGALAMAAGI
jgi:hypothetical protein